MRVFTIDTTKFSLSAEGFDPFSGEGPLQIQIHGLRFFCLCGEGKRYPPPPSAGFLVSRAYLVWRDREGFLEHADGGVSVTLNSQSFSELRGRFAGKYDDSEHGSNKFIIEGVSPSKGNATNTVPRTAPPPRSLGLAPFPSFAPASAPAPYRSTGLSFPPKARPLLLHSDQVAAAAPASIPAPPVLSNISLPIKRVFLGIRLMEARSGHELVMNAAHDRLEMCFADCVGSRPTHLEEHIPRASIETVYIGQGPGSSGAFLALLLRKTAELRTTMVGGVILDPSRSMSSSDYSSRPNKFVVVEFIHACDGDVLVQIMAHWMGDRASDVVYLAEHAHSAALNGQVALILTLDRGLGPQRTGMYTEVSERAKLEMGESPPDAEAHAAAEKVLLGQNAESEGPARKVPRRDRSDSIDY